MAVGPGRAPIDIAVPIQIDCNIDVPNIIAIVDDIKLRSQIESYFKEIDAEGIRLRFFSTGYEFEQKYFASKAAPVHPLNQQPGFEKLSFPQIESTLAIPLVSKPVLPHPSLRLNYNLKTMKVVGVDPKVDSNQTVFNRFPEDLANQSNLFGQIVPKEFVPLWQSFIGSISSARQQITIALMGTEREVAWFKVGAQKTADDGALLDFEEVTEFYRPAIQAELVRREANQEENEELQLLSEIDLIVFKVDCVAGKVPKWLDQTFRQLRDGGFFPKEKITRFVLLKYEDDGISKVDVMQPRLDDLVYLPLDRLIFLQKLEIILALPKKTSASFLFTQEVGMDIEISKLSKLERLSDLGLAIRNPVRLTQGLLGHFFLTLPDEDSPIDMWGKVVRSEPHPERANEFLVYFSFFGLHRNDAAALKRYMAKSARFATFVKDEREAFRYNPDNLFTTNDDRRMRHIAVLSLDEQQAAQMKSNLTKDIDLVKVVTESSYAAFVNRYMNQGSQQFAQPPMGAGDKDLYADKLVFTIRPDSLEMTGAPDIAPIEGQTYFGEEAIAVFAKPDGWLKAIHAVAGNKDLLIEQVRLASEGLRASRLITALNAAGEGRIFNFSAKRADDDVSVQVSLSLPSKDELKVKEPNELLEGLDLVVMDLALVPGANINGFITALTDQANKNSLLKNEQKLKFVLVVENEKQLRHRDWAHPELIGIIVKPLEMRPLCFFAAYALNTPYSLYRLDNVGWLHTLTPIHVAKDVRLEKLSEFGAELRHSRPIAPGTILFLRGGIFDNAPNRCLAARFYHCEDHPTEKGQFLCTTTYFGINDAFMKYARRWFRETYAHSKQQQS